MRASRSHFSRCCPETSEDGRRTAINPLYDIHMTTAGCLAGAGAAITSGCARACVCVCEEWGRGAVNMSEGTRDAARRGTRLKDHEKRVTRFFFFFQPVFPSFTPWPNYPRTATPRRPSERLLSLGTPRVRPNEPVDQVPSRESISSRWNDLRDVAGRS